MDKKDNIPSNSIFKKFEIHATECHLQIGDRITSDTVIGKDFKTGKIMTAGFFGQVKSINFNATNHTLIVLIKPY